MLRICLIALLGNYVQNDNYIDVQDLVRKAAASMQADWLAAPEFGFVQVDCTTSKGETTCKTQRVFMIAGSDYYMPISINNQPLTADQQKLEVQKLREEIIRRAAETPMQTKKRREQYQTMRDQNAVLLNEFMKAFEFTLAGEETINNVLTYVLAATPKVDYRPPNRTAKILTGMKGQLWINKEDFHWLKAEAEVIKPVSIFGFFAKVSKGTKMQLEMRPVTRSVWQISRFTVEMRISVLWRRSTTVMESSYRDYQPANIALSEALEIQTK